MARSITLVELLVAVSLIFMVILSAAALYIGATNFVNTFSVQSEMQNEASIALQDMVRNIYLADRVDWDAGSPSQLTVWQNDTESFQYWQDGSQIKRGEVADHEIIAERVKLLEFLLTPASPPDTYLDILQIDIVMDGEDKLADLWYVTKVTIRKYEYE
jgi:type II secretory pathway pseudopilin PulG